MSGLETIWNDYLSKLTTEDWIGIAGAVIAASLLFKETYVSIFRKPRLKIVHDEDAGDLYSSQTRLIINGKDSGIERKFLRIYVKNKGRTVASNCKAEIRFTKWEPSGWVPSTRRMLLTWNDEVKEKNIGAKHGSEPVLILFGDSNLEARQKAEPKAYALTGTKDALDSVLVFIRAQDALGVGDYEAEITVRSDEGGYTREAFEIHIGTTFDKIWMKKIPRRKLLLRRVFSTQRNRG